ncbi:MAG: hypothetical protein GF383_10100, partial [Candidatus Lokiarchaeota archaeon]|nr:hypothetical protein [Candidatus Lokiarchaeota archaeon]MBD3340892.1 hypothetical protein [Candidatus Lokiarchaeota archaeon]
MNNRHLERFFLIIMVMCFMVFIFNNSDTTEETRDISNKNSTIDQKTSDYWDITNLIIDDINPSCNWTYVNSTYDWCSGAGTWDNPYIIENLTINPVGSGSAITIANSSTYFIIRNCTIRNTGLSSEDAGIKLNNVNNSRLQDNKFVDINRIGIFLKNSCSNNTIVGNYLFEDYPYVSFYMRNGIYLKNFCNNNTILNNNLHGIGRFDSYNRGAIQLENNCSNNNIENNIVNRSMHGIYLVDDCYENYLFNNSVMRNDRKGILISTFSDCNAILNNTIHDNSDGIYIEESCEVSVVLNNTIYNNDNIGIYFIDGCEYSVIINNIIYQNDIGIKIETYSQFCKYFDILDNYLASNQLYGIYLDAVSKVNLWDNELHGCGFLIDSNNINHHREILLSSNNTVNGKPVYYYVEKNDLDTSDFLNAGQIILIDCNNTFIANLDFSFCSIGLYVYGTHYWGYGSFNHTISNIILQGNSIGLFSRESHNIDISNVTAKDNVDGFSLTDCNYTTFDNCTISYNSDSGLSLLNNHYSNISNSFALYNKVGFYISGCEDCGIINNIISNNAKDGLKLNGGKRTNILGNIVSLNNESGIHFWSSNSNFHLIENNTISYNKEQGIYFNYDCHYNEVMNNTIFSNEMNGIFLKNDCTYNNITLNQIHSNKDNGIYLYDECNANNLSFNQIYDNCHHGIYISYLSDSNIISNNTISKNCEYGIYLYYNSDYCNITGNELNDMIYGIYIYNSINSFLCSNEMNLCGLFLAGDISELGSHTIKNSNLVNQKNLYYYVNQTNLNSDSFLNAGQIILIQCNDTIVQNVNTSYGSVGVSLYECYNITLNELISSNNRRYGIYLKESENCTLMGNKLILNDLYGLYLSHRCKNINISGNLIEKNLRNGVQIRIQSDNNHILNNNITRNERNGIYIEESSGNVIEGNIIEYNVNDGINTLYWCDYIKVVNNSLSHNKGSGFTSNDISNYNDIIANQIINNTKNGIYFIYASRFNITDNSIFNN